MYYFVCKIFGHIPFYNSDECSEWIECKRCGKDVTEFFNYEDLP